MQTSRPRRRFSTHRLRLLRRHHRWRRLLHRPWRSHHENRHGQNRCRFSSLSAARTRHAQRSRRSRRSGIRPSSQRARPRLRRSHSPRPRRHSRLRLQHSPYGLRLRRRRRLFHHRRLTRPANADLPIGLLTISPRFFVIVQFGVNSPHTSQSFKRCRS